VNNSNTTGKHEHSPQKKYGAIPSFVIIGFLAWMIKIFIGAFRNHDNVNIILELLLVLFTFYSYAYICKILYLHCDEKNLGIFGRSNKIIGIVISIAIFLLLNISVNI